MKDLNIVFLNYFVKDDILQALRSLFDDLVGCPYDVHVTVADNSGNQDRIRETLSGEFPSVAYVDCGGNVGFGRGHTIGFQSMPARYYFALNRDTIIPSGKKTIERLIRFMDEHPRIGCIGPKLLNTDGSIQDSCYRFDSRSMLIKPLRHLNWNQKYQFARAGVNRLLMKDFDHESTRPVDWVLGAAMIVRKEVIDLIGWFDERYFMYLEDADWCRTMWEHGWPVYYVHDIEIVHHHARDSAKIPGFMKALIRNPLTRIHAKSWIKYLWKWRGNFGY